MAYYRRRSKAADLEVVNSINVTPFIDVMLVLLIIFMVVAPLSTVNIPLNLPSSTQQANADNAQPIVVSLDAQFDIFVNEQSVSKAQLATHLAQLTQHDLEKRIYIRADKAVPYEKFMQLLDQLSQLGYRKVALVTEQVDS
ncbi:ExbD/TolR family protein [Acinetobacter larvae]|uniref:Biopolymer transporter ExbD n=1 Tax=Acinetobacter larvae TaxID=1789224 RepID=A0A1B2M0B7_9GAMM|nr:biopolymer transporter ExbD [Acinetobacter larvae]AOA58615.1 hypothetical protein BFG52_09800 [Acinetobacter larvae]